MWFDRSELRGGDAWDSQIKKQIHDCALFVPLISAHTNARIEGYFRGEWNLATRRLVNRAHDAAFLMPVVIDETREADARVPEEFLRAQWTWLPGGETPPAFAQRVRQLLGLDRAAVPTAKAAATGAVEPSARSPGSARPRSTPPVRRVRTRPHCAAAGSGRWGFLVLPRRERRACRQAGNLPRRRPSRL